MPNDRPNETPPPPPPIRDAHRIADHFSDEELRRMAEIQPEDIERAKQAWRSDAPPAFKDLLDAPPDDAPDDAGEQGRPGGGDAGA